MNRMCLMNGLSALHCCSAYRAIRQRERVKYILNRDDEVLSPVQLIRHRRGDELAPNVEMPQSLSVGRVQRKQVTGIIGAKKQTSGSGENAGNAFALSDLVVPHNFAGTKIESPQ